MPFAKTTPKPAPTTPNRLRIDFLFLDLETCTRCRGADERLESALEDARQLFAATGAQVEVNKIHVETAEQARELRFASSPTIRVNGRDIALELRESSCGSEACTDGCGDSIACRVWVRDGEEHTVPPVAMIAEAILRAVHGRTAVGYEPDGERYQLPANLERFFAGKAVAEAAQAPCCVPAERRSCCNPEDKAQCCGASSGRDCGCR